MRVLLDESLPRPWAREIPGHEVKTVGSMGWLGFKNGALLEQAVLAGFAALITADQNMEYQQNLRRAALGVVVVRAFSNRIQDLRPLTPAVLAALDGIRPGEVRHIGREE